MKSFKLLILLLGVTLSLTQCIDQEFDSPPLTGPTVDVPDEAVITIATLMEQFSLNNPVALDAGSYIRGAVVGSDKSGNIFKTLMVQDATAGIAIIIDDTDLFDTYYVGREVYIKLDNLYLGDFAGLPQLGMAPNNGDVSRIPGALLSDIVLPAAFNVSVTPTPLLLGQLNDAALNTLVQLDNVEFAAFELGETYATAIPAQNIFNTENRMISNCDGFEVAMVLSLPSWVSLTMITNSQSETLAMSTLLAIGVTALVAEVEVEATQKAQLMKTSSQESTLILSQ